MTDETTPPSPSPSPPPTNAEPPRAALQLTFHELGAIKTSPGMTEFSNKLSRALQMLSEMIEDEAGQTRGSIERALEQARSQDVEALTAMASVLSQLQKERTVRHEDLARSERLLQSLTAMTQRLEGLVQSSSEKLSHLIEKESATTTGARRQLWDEAARFKQEVRRELKWLIRAPILGLLVLILTIGALWFRRQPPATSRQQPTTSQSPAPTTGKSPARPAAARPSGQR